MSCWWQISHQRAHGQLLVADFTPEGTRSAAGGRFHTRGHTVSYWWQISHQRAHGQLLVPHFTPEGSLSAAGPGFFVCFLAVSTPEAS